MHLLLSATAFAAEKHQHQRRKDRDATPYINHPIAVAEAIQTIGGVEDVEILIAALLHDTIEDTETTPQEIEALFGARVRTLVEAVSDDKTLGKEARKAAQIAHAPQLSTDAAIIKLADKLCNCRDLLERPPMWDDARKRDYFDWAEQVVTALPAANAALLAACLAVIETGKTRFCSVTSASGA